jgi:hypothetical protein
MRTRGWHPDPPADEEGMAMITAILVSMVVLFLGYVATGLSDHSFSATRVDHKRITTFHAAESGIDEALQVLQTTARASLPCASPLARSLGGGAYAPDYLVTFTYYAAYPVAGSPMSCPLAAEPAAAVVRSVGGSSDPIGPDRVLEATVRLVVPSGLGAFPRTVFSDGAIEYDGTVDLAGDGTRVADIYTNGAFNCDRAQTLDGNVIAQSTATLSNACSMMGSLAANGAVSATGNVFIGGDVTSSTGGITLSSGTTVSGDTQSVTAPSVDGTSSIGGTPSVGSSPAPPATTFPTVNYAAADWSTAGFTVRTPASCAAALSDLTTLASGWTTPTVMRVVGCRLDIPATPSITLKSDVAIVSDRGFDLAAGASFTTSTASGSRLLLIVPAGSSCSSSLGRVVMGSGVTFNVPLSVFAYTPCLIEAQNSLTMYGQLYGGSVRFLGLRLAHRDVGTVPGYVVGTLNVAREVTLVAKREVAT